MTRISKIARLPHTIREQLNHRLANGEVGRTILKWLNDLPETRQVLAELFEAKPITQQNLSEWRYTGYKDWLLQQERLNWYTHLTENEREIRAQRKGNDAFEAFGFLMLAEQGQALAELQEEKDPDARQTRLEKLTHQFTRMQNAFSRSRHVALWWTKWNEGKSLSGRAPRLVDPRDYEQKDTPPETSTHPTGMQPTLNPEIPSQSGLSPEHSIPGTLPKPAPLLEERERVRSSVNLDSQSAVPQPELPNSQLINSSTSPAPVPELETPNSKPETSAAQSLDPRPSTLNTPERSEGVFHPIPPCAPITTSPAPKVDYRYDLTRPPYRGRRSRCLEG